MEFNPSEEGEKLEPNEDIYCEFCQRKKLGCNDTNWMRHKKACKAKEDKKVQSKRKGTFFNKKLQSISKLQMSGLVLIVILEVSVWRQGLLLLMILDQMWMLLM